MTIPGPARASSAAPPPEAAGTAAWISRPGSGTRVYSATSAAIFGEEAAYLGAIEVDDFLKSFVHPDDHALVARAHRALEAKSEPYDIRFRILRRDGTFRHVRETAAPIAQNGGSPGCFVGNVIDVTRQTQNEQDLREARKHAFQADQARSLFLSNMNHELRTPLNAIIGFSQIMETEIHGALGDPRYRQYVTDIKESGLHLLQLINDVLNLSMSETDQLNLVEQKSDLRWIIDQVLGDMSPPPYGKAPTVRIMTEPLDIKVDVRMVKRALGHLLMNAFNFSGDEPDVDLTAGRASDGSTFISIEDRGIGMTDEEIELALKPFDRAGTAFRQQPGGSGLGLPYAQMIMEQHQGSLKVRSTPGHGTTVILRFPPQRSLP